MNFPDHMSDEDMQVFRREVELSGDWQVFVMKVERGGPPREDNGWRKLHEGRLAVAFTRTVDEKLGPPVSVTSVQKFVFTQAKNGVWVQDPFDCRENWEKAIDHADSYEAPL